MSIKRFSSLFLAIAFMLNMFSALPIEAFAVTADSHVYEKDGYTVTYKIGSEWDNNRSVEVTIKNTGEESILNWALKYDVGGKVYNLWNSMVYSEDEDGTVIKNNGYNYEIEPGQSANYGYIVTGAETLIPEDIELCSRRIDVKSGYEVDFNITNDWYTGFQAEVSIKNTSSEPIEAWTLLFEGNFDIVDIWNSKLLSSENRCYEVANQLWTTPIQAGESASFGFTADKSATENAEISNYQLTAVIVGESVLEKEPANPNNPEDDIDYELDTDKDGLPDYYEDIIGTDKSKADTDGDGLPDYYEVFYLGTDPLKADSDDNGVNDGNEDNDKDGLSNAKELELGTDPNNDDTDCDGLSDGAEVNTHGTDPLKYDTDDDGISDGDEITLGLNPNSSSTNGIPDNERTFVQTVDAESEVLSVINDDESVPFNVSLEIKAAGVAEKNLSAYESGYSAVMRNDAVIGIIPQFSYINRLSVEEVKVKFELDNSITSNTLGTFADGSNEFTGIKRLNIFKYFEDINMLLPVETFHDTNNNIVYTVTDCLGTYCLMDMEIWLDSLGISSIPEKAEVEESEAMSQNSIDNDIYMCYNVSELNARSNSDESKDNINVVFIIDTRESQERLDNAKKEILDVSRTVLTTSSNGRIYIFEQHTELSPNNRYKVYSTKGSRFFTNFNDLAKVLSEIKTNGSFNNDAILSDSLDGVLSVCDLNRKTYVFSLFNQENVIFREDNGYSLLDAAVKRNVDISVIAKIDNSKKYGYAHDMYKRSGGILVVDTESNYADTILKHIYKKVEGTAKYNVILATGLTSVNLLEPITEEYAMLAATGEIDQTQPDTDRDGLPDYMEINFRAKDSDGVNLIEFKNGVVDLPKYSRCISCKSELTYVQDGLKRFNGHLIENPSIIDCLDSLGLRVLPIFSDPTSEDGDKDTVPDNIDAEPLVPYLMVSDCIFESDSTHSVSKHALIACVIEGEASYRCLNCDECFIAPESQDSLLLNENEYAIVQALRYTIAQLINSGEYSLNYIESLYMIIDEIRSYCVVNGSTSYDYSDRIGNLRSYISPMKYIYGKNSKKHCIDISIYQTTKLDVYIDMQTKLIIAYGLEFVASNFLPPFIYPTFVYFYDKFTYNEDLSEYLNYTIMGADSVLHWSNPLTGVGIPNSFSSLIGIGNLVTISNYSKSFNAITNIVDEVYHNYMYDISIQIKDLTLGTEIYMVKIEFDSKPKVVCSNFKKASSNENLQNSVNVNTYKINNYTDEKNISDFKKEICKGE